MSRPTPFLRRRRLLAGALLGAAISAPAAYACPPPVARVDVYARSEQRTLDIRGFFIGDHANMKFYPFPERRVLEVEHARWWRSASESLIS